MTSFDFSPVLAPGLPAPAAKWTGLARYSFDGGNNDGFVRANAGSNQGEAMSYHTRDTAPLLYALADQPRPQRPHASLAPPPC